MKNHTKGIWTHQPIVVGFAILGEPKGIGLAQHSPELAQVYSKADASLICAAPEMLRILEDFQSMLEQAGGPFTIDQIKAMHKVIAKARGES